MNKLIIILVILILVVYIKYYLSPNPIFQILQTSISKARPKLLFEKSPIVIEEPLVNASDLLSILFKYLYILKKNVLTTSQNVIQQNKCKYLVLSPKDKDGAVVQIVHPKHSRIMKHTNYAKSKTSIAFVDIQLKQHQCMILPIHWWYKTNSSFVERIQLDDIVSVFLGKL